MKIIKLLTGLFRKREMSNDDLIKKTIRKMGYKNQGSGTFVYESQSGRTMIWLVEDGVQIKVYAHGYSESDFLPGPVTDMEKLKKFISQNEV
jgi:hypothetical protein